MLDFTRINLKKFEFLGKIFLQIISFCFQLPMLLLLTLKRITKGITRYETMIKLSKIFIIIALSFHALMLQIMCIGSFN